MRRVQQGFPRSHEYCLSFETIAPNLKLAQDTTVRGKITDQSTAPFSHFPVDLGRFISESKHMTAKTLSFLTVSQYCTRMKNRGNLPALLRFAFCVATLLATISFLAPRCPAQEMKYPPVGSVDGHAIFRGYCAPCHGLDGKGHGPAASVLNSKVADLTLLTKRARGQFPRDRVRNILEGTQTPAAHGSHEMPVWGPVFHQIEADQDLGNVRVQNLVTYIESLQPK